MSGWWGRGGWRRGRGERKFNKNRGKKSTNCNRFRLWIVVLNLCLVSVLFCFAFWWLGGRFWMEEKKPRVIAPVWAGPSRVGGAITGGGGGAKGCR